MERYDARLCAMWCLPVAAPVSGDMMTFRRIKEITENYATPEQAEYKRRDRVQWYAVLADAATERSETRVMLDDVQPADPEQFRRMKENYERRRSAAQDG